VDRRLIFSPNSPEPYFKPFLILISVIVVFRLGFITLFPLSMDEGYYWLWSQHPSLSYYDHPPMVGYMIGVTTSIFGNTEFGVRVGAVLLITFLSWLVYRISTDIFSDSRIGFYTALLLNSILIFDLGAVVMTPDTPIGFFWGLTVFAVFKVIRTGKGTWWYLAGLFCGLGLLSKYTAILLVPCIFLFLLMTQYRFWLMKKEPYLAFFLSLLLFSPVVYWNWQHEWISFGFQIGHGMAASSKSPLKHFFNFLGSQFAVLTPFVFLALIWACLGIGHEGWKKGKDEYKFLFFLSAPVLAFFFLNSLRTKIEGNWAVTGYFTATVGAVGYYEILLREKKGLIRKFTKGFGLVALISGLVITGFLYLQTVSTVIPMPKRTNLDKRFYGWEQIASEVDRITMDQSKQPFLFGNRYQIISLMTFYTKGHKPAYMIDGENRFPYLAPVDHLIGQDGFYISEKGRNQIDRVRMFFGSVEMVAEVEITRAGELVGVYLLYQCYNYKGGLIKV